MAPKRRRPRKPSKLPRTPHRDAKLGRLTEKQEQFLWYYCTSGVAGQAAIAAGYAPTHCYKQGYDLLHHPLIQAELQKVRQILEDEYRVTPERIVRELAMAAFTDPSEVIQIHAGGLTIANTKDLTPAARRLIVEASETVTEHGGTLKVKLMDRLKALELLARVFQLIKPDSPFGAQVPDPAHPVTAVAIYMPKQLTA